MSFFSIQAFVTASRLSRSNASWAASSARYFRTGSANLAFRNFFVAFSSGVGVSRK